MNIVKLGDPILTTPTFLVAFPWPEGRAVADGMFNVMHEHGGVGLAAPQVGIGLALFVFESPTGAAGVMVNPTLTPDRAQGMKSEREGCLSVPKLVVNKPRWYAVTVEGFDLDGHEQTWDCEGLEARIMQHETDHLAGRLCIVRGRR